MLRSHSDPPEPAVEMQPCPRSLGLKSVVGVASGQCSSDGAGSAGKRPEPERLLFLDEPVDVVLRAVLVVGHLEHARHAEQRLLSVSVAHHLNTNRKTNP